MNFIFSNHAIEQIKRRGLNKEKIEDILLHPDQVIETEGQKIFQSIVPFIPEGNYLIRVFVNTEKEPNLIITVYKTSKISKYYEGKI